MVGVYGTRESRVCSLSLADVGVVSGRQRRRRKLFVSALHARAHVAVAQSSINGGGSSQEVVCGRGTSLIAIGLLVGAVCASGVFAQAASAITGVVRDASGAVLPGVTVEASSPALIEKVRSAITDSQGQYRIVDLGPGTYTVTFSLVGFSTFKREGIDLRRGSPRR